MLFGCVGISRSLSYFFSFLMCAACSTRHASLGECFTCQNMFMVLWLMEHLVFWAINLRWIFCLGVSFVTSWKAEGPLLRTVFYHYLDDDEYNMPEQEVPVVSPSSSSRREKSRNCKMSTVSSWDFRLTVVWCEDQVKGPWLDHFCASCDSICGEFE